MLGKLSHRTRERLLKEGRHASAVVLEIAERGMAITHGAEGVVANTELAIKTRLRVEPETEPAFEVQERFRYPQLAVPSVGSRIAVIYDPGDHDTIMIDESAPMMPSFGGVTGAGTDVGSVLNAVKEAQAASGGDKEALARMLRARFAGDPSVVIDQTGSMGAPQADADPVVLLEKLAKLRDGGVLSEQEFQAQKARILGEGH